MTMTERIKQYLDEEGTGKTFTTQDVVDYLFDNDDLFCNLLEQMDNWNGYLGDDRWYPMDELDEYLCGKSPSEILGMVDLSFDVRDDFFRVDGYGDLESCDNPDYSYYLGAGFVSDLLEVRNHMDIEDDELNEMLDSLEE